MSKDKYIEEDSNDDNGGRSGYIDLGFEKGVLPLDRAMITGYTSII